MTTETHEIKSKNITYGNINPNNKFISCWQSIIAPKFNAFKDILDAGFSHHSDSMIQKMAIKDSDNLLDIGCGWASTSIQLAKMATQGEVLAIDCTEDFIKYGLEASRQDNLEFVVGDAATFPFEKKYDWAFSRFGTMFFENPVIGLKNISSALKPGAKLAMITWRPIEQNPVMYKPKEIALTYLPKVGNDAKTCGPGPFSMSDPNLVSKQLIASGFKNIEFHQIDCPWVFGESLDKAIEFQLNLGPAGEIVREAGDPALHIDRIKRDLSDYFMAYKQDNGQFECETSSWGIIAEKI